MKAADVKLVNFFGPPTETNFGGAHLSGSQAACKAACDAFEGAVLDVFAMWGGIEITVPPDWAVSNRVVPIMGGADDKSSGTQDSRHRLVLRGFVVMGGVEIKT